MKKHFYSAKSTLSRTCKNFSIFQNKWSILLIIILIAGCKKVIEETGTIGVCPKVISTIPIDGAVGVPLNTAIMATFNEVIDSSTITSSTFTVKTGTTTIYGLISYSGITATFVPAGNLAPNTTYTATITTGVRDLAHNAPLSNFVWSFTTGAAPDIIPPTVISTDPANGATGIAITKIITATFSKVMNSTTITPSTFILRQGATILPGTVTYAGTTASLTPTANLASNTTYTVTITSGVTDVAGNALVNNYVWSFTTLTVPNLTPPTVISTDPVNGATGVLITKKITATFSEAMDATTINTTTFLLKQGATSITGLVTYAGTTATFSPVANLSFNTTYTATLTTGAKNLAGNALASNYVWTFTTQSPVVVIPPPFLGSAAMFGAFGGSAGITNQGINTVINNGSIGTTGASTLITGFHDGTTGDVYTETPLNKGLVTGRIYTAPPFPGTAASFLIATNGLADATIAYNSISPASQPGGTDPGAGQLGNLTLAPGVYKSASGTFNLTSGNLTLDALGDPNAVWIFQTTAALTVGVPGAPRSIIMINGAQPRNVFWYVGSAATINGTGGGTMVGTIISSAGVTFSTAGNVVQTILNGRALSLNASVTMVNTTINVPL